MRNGKMGSAQEERIEEKEWKMRRGKKKRRRRILEGEGGREN